MLPEHLPNFKAVLSSLTKPKQNASTTSNTEAWEFEGTTSKQITWIWQTYLELKMVFPNVTVESACLQQEQTMTN